MAERKTLTLKKTKREGTEKPKLRGKKRIIVAPVPAPAKGKNKPAQRTKKPTQPKAKKIPPSVAKMRQFDEYLHDKYSAWRSYMPLQLGIEKELFRLISSQCLPYSKRVVRRLLHKQTRRREYLKNVMAMNVRVNLQNEIVGKVLDNEKAHADSLLNPPKQ